MFQLIGKRKWNHLICRHGQPLISDENLYAAVWNEKWKSNNVGERLKYMHIHNVCPHTQSFMKSILIFKCWKFIHCTFISEWHKYWWRCWDWLCWHTFQPQVDSWEMKCCLFIDSPIYPHVRQLIMATPVILKKRITDSHLMCDSCSLTSDPLLVEMGIILDQILIKSNFFPMTIFISGGIQCLYGSSMESKCQGHFWILSSTNNSLNTVAVQFLWGLHNLRVDYC